MVVIGRVTCLKQYYADGVEQRSIEIDKNRAAGLPYVIGRRVQVNLAVGGEVYSAGLRATERNKTVWISPDLFDRSGQKIRLADIISRYRCNQHIEIESRGKAVRILTPPGVDASKAKQSPRISKPSTAPPLRRASVRPARHSTRSHSASECLLSGVKRTFWCDPLEVRL